jgi:hypothetical protein
MSDTVNNARRARAIRKTSIISKLNIHICANFSDRRRPPRAAPNSGRNRDLDIAGNHWLLAQRQTRGLIGTEGTSFMTNGTPDVNKSSARAAWASAVAASLSAVGAIITAIILIGQTSAMRGQVTVMQQQVIAAFSSLRYNK